MKHQVPCPSGSSPSITPDVTAVGDNGDLLTPADHVWRATPESRAKLRDRLMHVRTSGSPESIHDLRRTLREVRVALRIAQIANTHNAKAIRALRRQLSNISGSLGAVRDVDVQRDLLRQYSVRMPEERRMLRPLRRRLRNNRARAWHRSRGLLGKSHIDQLVDSVASMMPTEAGFDDNARSVAAVAIWDRYEAILDIRADATTSETRLHQVRIRARQMRILWAQYFTDSRRQDDVVGDTLRRFTTVLGEAHDVTVALETANHITVHGRRKQDAVVRYAGALVQARDTLLLRVSAEWAEIARPEFRCLLADGIGRPELSR